MATTWYAQQSSVNINVANMWNDQADGLGNWLTWPPAAGDTLSANGKTAIAINVDITCAQIYTLTNGGGFAVADARTITADIAAGTTVCVAVSGAAYTLTIVGNITGGSSTNARGLTNANSAAIVVAGNVTGGSGTNTHGIQNDSTGPIMITGNVTGGSASSAHGVYHNSSGNGAITITGHLTGGSYFAASGLCGSGYPVVTVNSGNIIDSVGPARGDRRRIVWNPVAGNYMQVATAGGAFIKLCVEPAAAKLYAGTIAGTTTGTLHASNLHSGAGAPGVDLSAAILEKDVVVDDVTGTYEGEGGGGAQVGAWEPGAWR